MVFVKRLGFYLIGFSLGLVFLAYFLKGKNTEFCYAPNCRVLKSIRSKTISYAPEIQQLIDNKTVTAEQISAVLHDGKVLFKKSDTHSEPCKTYIVKGHLDANDIELNIQHCESTAEIKKITLLD